MSRIQIVKWWLLGCVVSVSACQPKPVAQSDDVLKQAASAFMDSYAAALRAHDTAALGRLYDPRGAYFVGNGDKRFAPRDSIAKQYRVGWSGPQSLRFDKLSYEVLGPDAVVVVGTVHWKTRERPDTLLFSYTGVLVKHGNEFKLRVEDESLSPANMRALICPPDSVRR